MNLNMHPKFSLAGAWMVCVLFNVSCATLMLQVGLDEVIDVYYQDILLFHFSPTEPIVKIGKGNAEFAEALGNFDITDVTEEIVSINLAVALGNPQPHTEAFITFKDREDKNIMVNVSLSCIDNVDNDDSELSMSVSLITPEDSDYNRIWLYLAAEDTERVYGAGEQYTYFNLRGHDFPIFTTEQGVGRDNSSDITGSLGTYYTTYWPQASFLSAKNNSDGDKYSLLLDNREYLVLNFNESETHEIFSHSTEITGTMYYSKAIQRLIPAISENLGKQPMLPDWAMKGAILGVQRGMDEVQLRYAEAKEANVDISALWIQDWSGPNPTVIGHRVNWNWKWDEDYYPGFDVFIQDLLKDGIYVTVYANPHLVEASELFNEANDNGYFLKDSDGETYLQDFGGYKAGTIDLLDESSRNWYRDTLEKNIITDLGCVGWMADFGEYTAVDMVSNNSAYGGEILHNALPIAWAQTNKEIVANSNTEDTSIYWMRAGGLGSSGLASLAWNGDQNVDFSFEDGLPSTIVATLNLAVSGMGVSHFDIGGYTTEPFVLERSEELFLRSAEYAVFTPVMRTHEGNMPERNVQFYSTQEMIIAFARLTQMHTRLFNYTKELVRQNAEEGVPVMRPMFYEFESDDAAWDIEYQYMYGPDLIIAPTLYEGMTTTQVYIPSGGQSSSWLHLWGGIAGESGPFVGPYLAEIHSPIGFPAVLYSHDSKWALLFEEIQFEFGAANP